MTRHSLSRAAAILIAVFLTCSCSRTDIDEALKITKPDSQVSFQTTREATAIFYPIYDSPDDKPWPAATFRFRIDNGYIGEIDDTQYIEVKITEGDHTLSVQRFDWSGTADKKPATFKVMIKPGGTYYFADHAYPDSKSILTDAGAWQGVQDIGGRKRVCPC